MLQQLGVADACDAEVGARADGASVMRRLSPERSPREFGFARDDRDPSSSATRGAKLVGPLPAALQNYTSYVALPWPGAPPTDPARAQAVAALMRHLQRRGGARAVRQRRHRHPRLKEAAT